MASNIAHNWGEATGISRSALIGLGAVLFGITIVVNVVGPPDHAPVDALARRGRAMTHTAPPSRPTTRPTWILAARGLDAAPRRRTVSRPRG